MIDKKIVRLNNGKSKIDVLVYLKEVNIKNNYTDVRAFCRIIGKQDGV